MFGIWSPHGTSVLHFPRFSLGTKEIRRDSYSFYAEPDTQYYFEVRTKAPFHVTISKEGQDGVTSYESYYQGMVDIHAGPNDFYHYFIGFGSWFSDTAMHYVTVINDVDVNDNSYSLNLMVGYAGGLRKEASTPVPATPTYVGGMIKEKFYTWDTVSCDRRWNYYRYYVPRGIPEIDDMVTVKLTAFGDNAAYGWKPEVYLFPEGEGQYVEECWLHFPVDQYDDHELTMLYPRRCARGENLFIFVFDPFVECATMPYFFRVEDYFGIDTTADLPHLITLNGNKPYDTLFASRLQTVPIPELGGSYFGFDFFSFDAVENRGYTIQVLPMWGECKAMWLDLDNDEVDCSGNKMLANNDMLDDSTYNTLGGGGMPSDHHFVECSEWEYGGGEFNEYAEAENRYRNTCSPIDRGFLADGGTWHTQLRPGPAGRHDLKVKFVAPFTGRYKARVSMDSGGFTGACGYWLAIHSDDRTDRVALPDYNFGYATRP